MSLVCPMMAIPLECDLDLRHDPRNARDAADVHRAGVRSGRPRPCDAQRSDWPGLCSRSGPQRPKPTAPGPRIRKPGSVQGAMRIGARTQIGDCTPCTDIRRSARDPNFLEPRGS
jgi:hypothetical protein